MTKTGQKFSLGCPAAYRIEVQGFLDAHWSEWFDGMAITTQIEDGGTTITTLTGKVVDQAALHRLLRKLYDLGLPLLTFKRIESDQFAKYEGI